jgi:beta-carotene hydroxylase
LGHLRDGQGSLVVTSSDKGQMVAPVGLRPGAAEARALPLPEGSGLDEHLRRNLLQQERAIGLKYAAQNVRTWPYTAIAIVCFAAWISFFPLTILGVMPLWLGCILATIFAAGGYVIGHEAMHSNLGAEGTPQRFWNELTGQIATIPLILPFSMVKAMHLLHHQHTNHPEKDPDAIHAAPNVVMAIVRSWLKSPAWRERHQCALAAAHRRIGHNPRQSARWPRRWRSMPQPWPSSSPWPGGGYAIEVALLWWLPRHLGLSYIHAVLSWAPHHPHGRTGRYDSTSLIRHPLGLWGSMGIDYHLIHHLYPYIPVHVTGAAYREMKPLLAARGVDCSAH